MQKDIFFVVRDYGSLANWVCIRVDDRVFESVSGAVRYLIGLGFSEEEARRYVNSLPTK
jgi:hypothetical protein